MINSMKNHIKVVGSNGYHTFNAGLKPDELTAALAEDVAESARQDLNAGDRVRIRGYDRVLDVLHVNGVFALLQWNEPGIDFRDFYALGVQHKGKYIYGTVDIHKAHLIKI